MASRTSLYRFRRVFVALLAVAAFCFYLIKNPSSYEQLDPVDGDILTLENVAIRDTQAEPDSYLARDVLEALAVKEKNTSEKYYRKLFYDNWGNTASGCNTREAILERDLKETVMRGCKVTSGILEDPYTGKEIEFVRGQDTSSAVQIDHVVALSNAWATGAYALDSDTRYEISQDPLNLIAVDGPANQEKSDQDASDWLPSNESFRCEYVSRQISVKYKYHLWVTPEEKLSMQKVLASCPEEPTRGLENL